MKIFANDATLSNTSRRNISVDSTTLKVDYVSLPIEVALKDFSDYDKVAIILNCSTVEASEYGQFVSRYIYLEAENLGKKLQDIFGQKDVSLYSKETDLAKGVCSAIDKYWNSHQNPAIQINSMINGNTFGVSGSWDNIIAQSKTAAMKSQVGYWQKSFANSMPSGLSLWVTDDIVLVPIIYTTDNFDPEVIKTSMKIATDPWISPLTGVIVGVKNNAVNARVITGLELGFLDNRYSGPFTHMAALANNGPAKIKKLIATTYKYGNLIGKLKADLDYTFDKSNANSHPLYCVSNFNGCGACNSDCHNCFSGCQACVSCDSCDSCQNCNSCQTVCQTSGYSKQNALVRVANSCSTSCNGCDTCVGGYHLTYIVDYYPCKACVASTGPDPSGCSGTGCAPCWGCNSETALRCVPTCETGCYKGCTADNATYYNRWHCDSTCMTCVGISQYACSECYGANNYDKVI